VQNIFHGRNNITSIFCFRYIIVNTLHKVDNKDNNNRIAILGVVIVASNIITLLLGTILIDIIIMKMNIIPFLVLLLLLLLLYNLWAVLILGKPIKNLHLL